MCQFFSLVSNGRGRIMFFDAAMRKKILAGKTDCYDTDSHTSIARQYGQNEDRLNKFEYNPLTKEFKVDQINTKDDSEQVERFCQELDFSAVVPELVIKPIVHPFKDMDGEVSEEAIALVKRWASVWDSVWDSVWASMRDSVWDSVWDSMGASVWDSVGASVWDSVGASVWASMRAYISSFFDLAHWKGFEHLPPGENPFRSAIDLWEMGLIPSFDGTKWRLHAKSGVVWEGAIEPED
jgi:hypothetical protein